MRVRAPGALGWEEASLLRLHGNWENDGAGPLEERKKDRAASKATPPSPPPPPAMRFQRKTRPACGILRRQLRGWGGGHSIKIAASPPNGLNLSENLGAVSAETGEGGPSSLVL